MDALERLGNISECARAKNPLVHNITNYVTVNDCANIQLAAGGSPIMADDLADVADITKICGALAVNIGTLNARTVKSMEKSLMIANAAGVPAVLDPVGCGASGMRSRTTEKLLKKYRFAVVRGNLSEMSFVAGLTSNTRGVDSSEADSGNDAERVAKAVAIRYGCTAAVTGKVDTITDGTKVLRIENGNAEMGKITGTGCMATALIGVMLASGACAYDAAAAGILMMGIAGDVALEVAGGRGTASMRIAIIDAISKINAQEIRERGKVCEN